MDDYGRLEISEANAAPRKGWALLQMDQIVTDQIFATEEFARDFRGLEPAIIGQAKSKIVPVTVRGTEILVDE